MRAFTIPTIVLSVVGFVLGTFAIAQPPAPERLYTPFDVVQVAENDAKGVAALNDPELQSKYCRYADLRNYSKARRDRIRKAVDFVVNSLNTQYRTIVRTATLPAGSDDPIVLRINLQDYGISPEAFDQLCDEGSGNVPIPEPYYHVDLVNLVEEVEYEEKQVLVNGWYKDPTTGKQVYGQHYENQKNPKGTPKKVKKKTRAAAPWLAAVDKGVAISNLIQLTQTRNPIVRADWFVVYASWAPAYYRLLGIKKNENGEKVFNELAGVEKRAEKSIVASVSDSKIVALHNRILSRLPTTNGYLGGYFWASADTDKGIDDEDYMNELANFAKPKVAAKELITSWYNTLQGYAVTDNKGNLLNVANPNVAIFGDQMPTKLQDKQVYAGLRSCAICHQGLIDINDKVRGLAQRQIALFITQNVTAEDKKKDPDIAKKIRDAFSPELRGLLAHDNAIHAAAIKACNDLTPQQNRDLLEEIFVEYIDGTISLEQAAGDAGLTKDQLEALLKKGVGLDYTLVSLLQVPPIPVSRFPWERQGHTALQQYLLGAR